MYITVDEVRTAGDLAPEITDAQIQVSILKYQEIVDRVTRQFFEIRSGELLRDGSGSHILHLPFPIIQLNELFLNESTIAEPAENYKVYDNKGNLNDDRTNPKIVMYRERTIFQSSHSGQTQNRQVFVRGRQNQKLIGDFGYVKADAKAFDVSILALGGNAHPLEMEVTDNPTLRQDIIYEVEIMVSGIYGVFTAQIKEFVSGNIVLPAQTFDSGIGVIFDLELHPEMEVIFTDAGATSMVAGDKWRINILYDGGTPELIKHATTRLVLIGDYSEESGIEGGGTHGALKREKTDGHEIEYEKTNVTASEFSSVIGDPEVSGILTMFKGPILIGASTWRDF